MATSTVPALLTALAGRLRNRAGLAGVAVATAPDAAGTPAEVIEFLDTAQDQEFAALGGRRREERYEVRGAIFVARLGAGEATATEARERAYALLAEIENELRADPTVGGAIQTAEVARVNLQQGASPDGRLAALEFWLRVRARI